MSCRAGLSVLELTCDPEFLRQVRRKSQLIVAVLRELPERFLKLVSAVRGTGMMFGIEHTDQSLAGLALALLYTQSVTATYSV